MIINIDKELIQSFVDEAKSYILSIRLMVEALDGSIDGTSKWEEIHMLIHDINGASSMIGASELSDIANYVEKVLEDTASGKIEFNTEVLLFLRNSMDLIDRSLDSLSDGNGNTSIDLEQVRSSYLKILGGDVPNTAYDENVLSINSNRMTTNNPAGATCNIKQSYAGLESLNTGSYSTEADLKNVPKEIPDELMEIFRVEINEHLEIIRNQVEHYNKNKDDLSPLQDVRRGVHTIKVAASMICCMPLVSYIAFYVEEVLDKLFDYKITPAPGLTDLILSACELIDKIITDGDFNNIREESESIKMKFDELQSSLDTGIPEPANDVSSDSYELNAFPYEESIEPGNITEKTHIDADDVMFNSHQFFDVDSDIPDELLEVFLVEANEHFHNIGRYLNNIERDRSDKESLQEVRRSVHTIKGAAGMVGFDTVSKLAHRMEDLLDNLFEGSMVIDEKILHLLFSTYDLLEDIVNSKADNGEIKEALTGIYANYSDIVDEISLTSSNIDQEVELAEVSDVDYKAFFDGTDSNISPAMGSVSSDIKSKEQSIRKHGDFVRIPIERLDDLVNPVSELVVNRSTFEQRFGKFLQELDEMSPVLKRLRELATKKGTYDKIVALWADKVYSPIQPFRAPMETVENSSGLYDSDKVKFEIYTQFQHHKRELTESESDIRAIYDKMLDITGDFKSYLNRQQRLTSEVQDKLMRLRMVPLSTIVIKLHRTTRVTAAQQNKNVELIVEGEDVELDKTVLEEMADPLLHIIRNSVDHGIELPELRRALNKNQTGTVFLKSYYEGTQVVIEVGDDGGGLVPEVLRNTAVKNGFVSDAESVKMSDEDLYRVIFLPGFSSASQISEISGRGVGMDIVNNTVSKLKGTISVKSVQGKGVTFTIRLPITLSTPGVACKN